MTPELADYIAAGKALDVDDRIVVAHSLLASVDEELDTDEGAVDAAWRDEIGSRVDAIHAGKVALVPYEESRARARALLDELHGRAPAPR